MTDFGPQNLGMPKIGPTSIVIYHVGGDDGIGPVGAIFDAAPNAVLVTFEIRDDAKAVLVEGNSENPLQVRIKVNRAVDEGKATKEFYVTTFPKSSSLFKAAPMARSEDPGYHFCQTWGENTQIAKTITVQTSSIEQIIEELNLPAPDVISIDAQGAELGILKGSGRYLSDKALAVLTEVEFSEIYHHQPLFDEQMSLLSTNGFRLVTLFNSQVWHPMTRMGGTGFLTAAEALFLKYFFAFTDGEERPKRGYADMRSASTSVLLKTCIIAMGFRMVSYAVKIAKFIRTERTDYKSLVNAEPMLGKTFAALEYYEKYESLPDRSLDYFVDAIEFENSSYLRRPVPDTNRLSREARRLEALFAQAIALLGQGDTPGARKMFRQILSLDPRHSGALHQMGVIALEKGDPTLAVKMLSDAVDVSPENKAVMPAYNIRGVAYFRLGRHTEALADFDKALALGAPVALLQFERAQTLRALGRHSEALAACDTALAAHPGNTAVLEERAALLKVLG